MSRELIRYSIPYKLKMIWQIYDVSKKYEWNISIFLFGSHVLRYALHTCSSWEWAPCGNYTLIFKILNSRVIKFKTGQNKFEVNREKSQKHIFSDFWPPSPLSVQTQTLNMIRNFSAKIRLKISISTTTPPYTNTKKVSQKVKYLLTTFNARGK